MEVKQVDIKSIRPNAEQPRKFFDEEKIDELALSIKSCGIIQPLTIRQVGFNQYEIVSGERRFKAAKKAGFDKVPCVIVSINDRANDLIALIENVQREDLNFVEQAKAYKKIMEQHDLSQEEFSKIVGKKQASISNMVRLLKLDDEVLDILLKGHLTQRHARCLLSLPDYELRLKAAKEMAKRKMTVRQSEDLVDRLKQGVVLNTKKKKNIKTAFNYRIYTNTIKQAYNKITSTGLECDYKENILDDKIEVVITIPKE